jgi:hypothetical protein
MHSTAFGQRSETGPAIQAAMSAETRRIRSQRSFPSSQEAQHGLAVPTRVRSAALACPAIVARYRAALWVQRRSLARHN